MTIVEPTHAPSHSISAEAILRAVAIVAILAGLAFGALEWAGHQNAGHQENIGAHDAPPSVEGWRGNSGSLPAAR